MPAFSWWKLIKLLIVAATWLSEWRIRQEGISIGEADEITRGLADARDKIARAQDARTVVRERNDAAPGGVLDNNDGYRRD